MKKSLPNLIQRSVCGLQSTTEDGSRKTEAGKKGFTLVELLVVVTIIAVLSVIGMVVYSGVSARARDTRRMAEIDAIQTAMEKKYRPGVALPYQLLNNADFVNNIVPTDPLTNQNKCGNGGTQICDYCYWPNPTAGKPGNNATCPDRVSQSRPPAGTGYIICANLETAAGSYGGAAATFYCKSNLQ